MLYTAILILLHFLKIPQQEIHDEKFYKKMVLKHVIDSATPDNFLENQHLPKRKQECKAARKAILKAGRANSPEAQMISKESLSLVRQHNKL